MTTPDRRSPLPGPPPGAPRPGPSAVRHPSGVTPASTTPARPVPAAPARPVPGPPATGAGHPTSPGLGPAPTPGEPLGAGTPGAAAPAIDLGDRPVGEHVAVLEAELDRLQRRLATIDQL
ncbi:hypothetical protein GB931_17910 [Modestobacter sp. I12A-02628]|uniref:Uncharacterized protein n=1 Tax=Goekera deserti TaxID=2497753 RepID=A0A7K3WGI3_9ACTN|nr:hypothetical protein [Goekera deserti]MPQ99761.1 hypothetical protein [Goekera deserti]NDI46228.1 hypothetical protein [Goekera deserti]NEL54840.1 hypothetical protein [Goekera deserti]